MHSRSHISCPSRGLADQAEADWQDVVCRRRSGPPLRFKGVHLSHHSAGDGLDSWNIHLWQRKTPGFVAALTGPDGPDARSAKTLSDVMSWLEDLCRNPTTGGQGQTLERLLAVTPRQAAHHQELRQLAGIALAAWDHLEDQPSRQEPE